MHKPKGPESPSCAGDKSQVFMRVQPQREDQLLQFSGEDSINRIFWESSVAPSPIQGPVQEPAMLQGGSQRSQLQMIGNNDSTQQFQLLELASRLNTLTALVQGHVMGQNAAPNQQGSRNPSIQGSPNTAPPSPPGSSSSSSSRSGGRGGGGPPSPPRGSPCTS